MFDFIKWQFDAGLYSADDVRSFVPVFLSAEEADAILAGEKGAI